MKRFITHVAITAAAFVAAGLFYWMVSNNSAGYGIFDLLKGQQPVGAAVPVLAQGQRKSENRPKSPELLDSLELLAKVDDAMADLTATVVPSVVSINTKTVVRRSVPADAFGFFNFQQKMEQPGLGSGMIVSEDGFVVTNHHVITDVDEIQITTHDGTSYEADWVGSDPATDVAVLKIKLPPGSENTKFHPLRFGDSDKVRVGEMALAIGNPFGLSESVTRGIISAKQRQLSDGANEYFQVDAVINPGNSGGPLVNFRGEIIGVNVAIFTGQENIKVWQGIGLAIPSNEAREIYEAIAHNRPLQRGYMGVQLDDFPPRVTRNYGLPDFSALVRQVTPGSPAHLAGMKEGDIIVEFDGKAIKGAQDTLTRIGRKKDGEEALVKIIRESGAVTLKPRIISKSARNALQLKQNIVEGGRGIVKALGIRVDNLTPQQRIVLNLPEGTPAIVVSEINPGSQAEQRFRPGDLIHAINRKPVPDVETFYDLLGSIPQDKPSILTLSRNGNLFSAVIQF